MYPPAPQRPHAHHEITDNLGGTMHRRTAATFALATLVLAGCTNNTTPASPETATHTQANAGTDAPVVTPRLLSTVTVGPLLPTAEPLPEGLLARTDGTWTLVRYSAVPAGAVSEADLVRVEYLLSPDGHRYQLPAHPGWTEEWVPGTVRALARQTDDAGLTDVALVNLETGAWSPVDFGPALALHQLDTRDVTVAARLAPNGSDLYVQMSPSGSAEGMYLVDLNPSTGAATDLAHGPEGTRWITPSPDGTHVLTIGAKVSVTDTAGSPAPVTALAGCSPSVAGWLSDALWFEACTAGTPNDAKNLYAVHTLDGQVWGVPNDGTPRHLLGSTDDTVWAAHQLSAADGTLTSEVLERVTSGEPPAPVSLAGNQMVNFAVTDAGLFGSTDNAHSYDGYRGLPGPLYAIDAGQGTSRLVVPEPDGADAWTDFLSGTGGTQVLHHADGTLEFVGE